MNYLIYFLSFVVCSNILAQVPQLFNTTWTLNELNLDGNIIIPSNPLHIGELTVEDIENLLSVTNIDCEKTFLGDFTAITNTGFELFDFVDPFGFDCASSIAFDYLENHSLFYMGDPTDFPNNPFNYEIVDENGALTLTITNGNNDTAIYRNASLSVEEQILDSIRVAYNPENETLLLTGSVLEQSVELFIV